MTPKIETYIECIHTCYPDLVIEKVTSHNSSDGQFNVVIWVNDAIVFRFPRSMETAEAFTTEVKLLQFIQPHVSLPIPRPTFQNLERERCHHSFMGYWALPGKPLWPQTVAAIRDEAVLDQLAGQLARFLQELHDIQVDELDLTLPVLDGREVWAQMYEDFREHLFLHTGFF